VISGATSASRIIDQSELVGQSGRNVYLPFMEIWNTNRSINVVKRGQDATIDCVCEESPRIVRLKIKWRIVTLLAK
jgi:hypothetical protein